MIAREWQRVDPSRLAGDEQELWARIAGRQLRYDERQQFAEKLARASRECRELFLMSCAAENPNRRLRLAALGDRVATAVDRASFDDLVTIVISSPMWEKDRVQGARILLRALAEGKVDAPDDIVARWTWRLARATRKLQDRRASAELPDAKRLLGAVANSRGHRHDENVARLVNVALEQPIQVGVALLASAEGYTPTAQQLIERARERLGTSAQVADALAENLPAPKAPSSKSRRRRRRKKPPQGEAPAQDRGEQSGEPSPSADGVPAPADAPAAPADGVPAAPADGVPAAPGRRACDPGRRRDSRARRRDRRLLGSRSPTGYSARSSSSRRRASCSSRKRVSSAASVSPDGRFRSASASSARRSSSLTYAAVSSSAATASLTWRSYSSPARSSSPRSSCASMSSASRAHSACAARGLGASDA